MAYIAKSRDKEALVNNKYNYSKHSRKPMTSVAEMKAYLVTRNLE